MANRIKKDDLVVVIAGRDKGQTGRVLSVIKETDRVLVEGINKVTKHLQKSQKNPEGGIIKKELAIHISNVMPLDSSTKKGTRVRVEGEGKEKKRVAAKSGSALGT